MIDMVVAFDEAGNSGGNLIDDEQPAFVLASVCLPELEAADLLGTAPREYKFASLKRSAAGRASILRLLDSPSLIEERYLISGFHKPFMAVTKMVDLLVEPLAHRDGVDLYDQGANLAFSNMLYFCLPTFLGHKVFRMMTERFVAMVREPSHRTIQKFYGLLDTAYRKHRKEEFATDIAVLLATRVVAEAYRERWDGSDLDPAIPAFVEHASVWTARLSSPFRIVHDASKPIANEQIVLEAMMSTSEKRQEIGYDRRKLTFPIAAREIELEDSATWPQLQIADIIASSAAYCLRAAIKGETSDFCQALLQTRVLSGSFRPVWPEMKVTPAELGTAGTGGIDAVDHIGEYVSKRLGDIPPKGRRRKV